MAAANGSVWDGTISVSTSVNPSASTTTPALGTPAFATPVDSSQPYTPGANSWSAPVMARPYRGPREAHSCRSQLTALPLEFACMSDLHWLSAIELATEIREGRVSSREALDHLLDRQARLDGPINAVVTIDAPRARAEADAADAARARGELAGPLHGLPMTVKDSLMTAGMRTTSGAPELADNVPTEDSWPVDAMRRAGAVIYGKTNLPIYAGDLQSYNEVFGTTHNPWNVDRTPGGSSGGSGAALAAGFTPLEIGSDIGGSIRFPAHMSGVVGHKPSYGIVPAHGQIPGPPGTLTLADLAVVGPMARTVDDCVLGLDLMAGPNRWDSPAWRLELPPATRTEAKGLRVAAWLDDEFCPVDDDVKTLLAGACTALEGAGAHVDADARPGVHAREGGDHLRPPAQRGAVGRLRHGPARPLGERHLARDGRRHPPVHRHAASPVVVGQRAPPADAQRLGGVLRRRAGTCWCARSCPAPRWSTITPSLRPPA